MEKELVIFTDGGSRGNPGPSSAAYVIKTPHGKKLTAKAFFLGKNTNNYAEYTAVIKALEEALIYKPEKVNLYSDSELLVKQLNGQYKVKSKTIKPLYEKCTDLLHQFPDCRIEHVYRENNKQADLLANQAMDVKKNITESKKPKNVKPLRIAILLSGGGTTMQNILENIEKNELAAEIPLVISSRSKVKGVQRAKNAGLNLKIIRKKDYPDIDEFSKAIGKQLNKENVELVVQAGWLCLWKIPDKYKNRVMNIHPALLPSFGGKGMWGHHVHEAVLDYGCKVSGCTVHFCTNEYDKGPIIVQRACPVREDDTPDTLAERVFKEECIAYPHAIKLFQEGRLKVHGNIVRIK